MRLRAYVEHRIDVAVRRDRALIRRRRCNLRSRTMLPRLRGYIEVDFNIFRNRRERVLYDPLGLRRIEYGFLGFDDLCWHICC